MWRIFIGWDSKESEAAHVLAYSLAKHSSVPLDIRFLVLDELGLNRPHDPLASTEFTYSRFLVPHLCSYAGPALFLDSDMLILSDIAELLDLYDPTYALQVVQQDFVPTSTVKKGGKVQTSYPRKNWSSLMMMNCRKLTLWSKEYVESASGAQLHQFQGIEKIGDLPREWNHLDALRPDTKLLHFTSGGPWLPGYEDHPHAALWKGYALEAFV